MYIYNDFLKTVLFYAIVSFVTVRVFEYALTTCIL